MFELRKACIVNYYIADLHFGHANVIKLNNRPFKSIEEMNKTLIDNWNSVVTSKDNVYILGDFSYKSDPDKYLSQLNGNKYLILGNHDSKIRNNKVGDLYPCFGWVKDYAEISDNNKRVIMFHYPICEWAGYFRDSIHLYGHIHNNLNKTSDIMSHMKNAYNVGADILDYYPRTLDEVIYYNKAFYG